MIFIVIKFLITLITFLMNFEEDHIHQSTFDISIINHHNTFVIITFQKTSIPSEECQ